MIIVSNFGFSWSEIIETKMKFPCIALHICMKHVYKNSCIVIHLLSTAVWTIEAGQAH